MRHLFLLMAVFFLLNGYSISYLKVMYVSDRQSDCDTGKCLLTRDEPIGEWKTFHYPIEGFNYKEGYEYCLLVEIQTSDSTPSARYLLSEIKSKIKKDTADAGIAKPALPIADSSTWLLYKLKMKDGIKTFSLQKAYLQFDIKNNTVNGNTDCNTFNASISIDNTQLVFENILTTKMACKKHSIEADFLKALTSATHYKVASKMLYLYKGKSLLALFTKKK
ncbi:MAG: META domain-containing protein [Chitinophagales bacterium]